MRLFETFWIEYFSPNGPPLFFWCFATQWMSKNCKGSPFLHFSALWYCSKISFQNFFGKFFQVPKGLLFNFFSYFATSWRFTKPEGSPFTILSLRYSADFGRSRLVSDTPEVTKIVLPKVLQNLKIVPVGPGDWTKKVFPFFSAWHTIPGETKGSPFSSFSAPCDFSRNFFHQRGPFNFFEVLRQNGCWKIRSF